MFDHQHGNSAAEQILDTVQRIAIIGKPRGQVFKALDELPELRKLIPRKTLIQIEQLPHLEGEISDRLVRSNAMSIARPLPVMAGAALLFVCAVLLFGHLGQEFTPTLDEKNIVMEVRRVPSTALAQSQAMQLLVESQISKFPEVSRSSSRASAPDLAADPMPPNTNPSERRAGGGDGSDARRY
ncbi:efflux RND transporter permease subunit [Bradyrhizobium sp. TZ2]